MAWAVLNSPRIASPGALKYLANGWSLKPYLQAQTGLPYSLTVNGTTPNQCYAAGCLEAAGSGLSGTSISYIPQIGRNTFRYPRTINLDMRAEKDFTFREKYDVQLLGEAFNLANHQNVTGIITTGYQLSTVTPPTGSAAAPTSTLVYQNATFGAVTAANSNNAYQTRQVQLALRVVF